MSKSAAIQVVNAWLETDFNSDEDIWTWFQLRRIADDEQQDLEHSSSGRPKKQRMDQANAVLIARFPVIAKNPKLLAILEYLNWLDLAEAPTSRFPSPESYGLLIVGGKVYLDDFYPEGIHSKEEAVRRAKMKVKNVRARARDRVKRSVKFLEAQGHWDPDSPPT